MLELTIDLRSDATFARGDGVSGLVGSEIDHDSVTGLPFIRGRVLKGLLVEECANLTVLNPTVLEPLAEALFGVSGTGVSTEGALHVGSAQFDLEFRTAVARGIDEKKLSASDVLEHLTDIRRQTSIDAKLGVPEEGSLRSTRVLLRGTLLAAQLSLSTTNAVVRKDQLSLLFACVLAVRRGGVARNRGRGRLRMRLASDTLSMQEAFQRISELIGGAA
jgi:CRISPR/Cas system CMR subunit Cmr4 (Cas7 group RAMP superfamily)